MGCSTKGWEYKILVRPGAYSAMTEPDDWSAGTAPETYYPSICGLTEIQDHVPVPGTSGHRALMSDETVKGNRLAGGPLRIRFGRIHLDKWLPRILGAAEATDVFKVADTLPYFQVLVDKGQSELFEYRDCKIARATFSGTTGGVVNMDLDIVATLEQEYSGSTFAAALANAGAYVTTIAARPLRFAEGNFVFDPAGTPVEAKFEQFQLVIDNLLEPKFYAGLDYLTCLDEGRRMVTLALPAAHTSTLKEYYNKGFDNLAGRLRWVADSMTTQVDMACLKWAKRSTTMENDGDTLLPLQMRAYRTITGDSGADDDVKFTNDPVS